MSNISSDKATFTAMCIALVENGSEQAMDAVLGVLACAEESVHYAQLYIDAKVDEDDLLETDFSLREAVHDLVDRYRLLKPEDAPEGA